MHDYITRFLPYLDSKELDINMAGYFSGNNGVHNINSRIIVFINCSIRFPWKPKLPKHIPQILEFLSEVTAEIISASVELKALIDGVLDLYTTASL